MNRTIYFYACLYSEPFNAYNQYHIGYGTQMAAMESINGTLQGKTYETLMQIDFYLPKGWSTSFAFDENRDAVISMHTFEKGIRHSKLIKRIPWKDIVSMTRKAFGF